MKAIKCLLFAAILFACACQKEAQNYIPQRINSSSVDAVWDSNECVMQFSSTAIAPAGNRMIVSGAQGTLFFSDSVTTLTNPSLPQGGQLSSIKFIWPNTAGTNLDFSNLKLWLLNGSTQMVIATKAADDVQADGTHFVQFTGLEDSTILAFTVFNIQLVKLSGKVTGTSGETFKTKAAVNAVFVNDTGYPNVAGLPVTCAGTSTIQ